MLENTAIDPNFLQSFGVFGADKQAWIHICISKGEEPEGPICFFFVLP